MLNFIQKITYLFLNIQEKLLANNLKGSLRTSYSNKTTKRVFSSDASLELTSKTEQTKLKLETNVENIVKKCESNPEKLLDFVKKNGTKVYKIPFASQILKPINYEEGFISETKGLKALYLNFVTTLMSGEKINLALKSEPMFVLNNSLQDSYQTIHRFYKWYADKLNMPGFNFEAQDNLQKFLTSKDNQIKEFDIEEILELKEAIARDVESVNFVIKLAKASEGSKNALGKMKLEGAFI